MFERFTDDARRAVMLAQEEARLLQHNYIGTEHLLLGLAHPNEGAASRALAILGLSHHKVRTQVEEIIGVGGSTPSGEIPFTPRSKKVLELSAREALRAGADRVASEHVLLGLVREGDGVAAQIMVRLGVPPARVREAVELSTGVTPATTLDAVTCSFCGRSSAVSSFVAGQPGVFICADCVRLAATIIERTPGDAAGPGPHRP